MNWWCESAWIDGKVVAGVRIITGDDGHIKSVEADAAPGESQRLAGLVFPGFANTHSHAFHRALRGRTQQTGDFWSWREAMYQIADLLDPDTYMQLATAVFSEMALAGFTTVGEFHYLHHQPGGERYDDPNVMGAALIEAARQAGIKLTLIDACYLTGGINQPLDPFQARFGDDDAWAWAARVEDLRPDVNTRIGAAVHSVRTVPADQIPTVVDAATGKVLHVHVSEQPAENEECRHAYQLSPTALLAEAGVLGARTTAVHATHLGVDDIDLLGQSGTTICMCPTTERDLGDGIGPAWALAAAGSRLALGTDQHAVIDPFEEARGLEMHERLATGTRGNFPPEALVAALTINGHRALGWPEGGRIAVGATCDLVAVSRSTVRTAAAASDQLMFAASAADVTDVVVAGKSTVTAGVHRLGNVARMLEEAINPLWD
jgi:formiminoglutamate deiminase